MRHPRKGFTFHLATDACAGDDVHRGGFGAVLTQVWEDRLEHVIAYASRSLKPNEENYSAYCWNWLQLLGELTISPSICEDFELFTDQKPLETLSKVHTKTLNRLQERLLEYDFKIKYRQGASNSAADALSRNVSDRTERFIYSMSDDPGDVIAEQKLDLFIMDVRDFILKNKTPGGSPEYKSKFLRVAKMAFFAKGLVWVKLIKHGRLEHHVLLCPNSMRYLVIDAAHCSLLAGHSGKQRTIDRVELGFWWPGLTYLVQIFLHKCAVCQEMQGRKPIPSPLNPLPTVGEQNLRVHVCIWICLVP